MFQSEKLPAEVSYISVGCYIIVLGGPVRRVRWVCWLLQTPSEEVEGEEEDGGVQGSYWKQMLSEWETRLSAGEETTSHL